MLYELENFLTTFESLGTIETCVHAVFGGRRLRLCVKQCYLREIGLDMGSADITQLRSSCFTHCPQGPKLAVS